MTICRLFVRFVETILERKIVALLKELAKIKTGVYLNTDMFGNAVYIKVSDFNSNRELIHTLKPCIQISQNNEHHLLQQGDLLFAAKGDSNFAAVYNCIYKSAVASSSFFVIKCSPQVLPEYLAWFLNHPISQTKLKAGAKGSAIPSISIKTLGELDVKLYPIKKQKLIVKIDSLRKKEKFILNELSSLNDKLIDTKLFNKL